MATSMETFHLMNRLKPETRDTLERRYGSSIPMESVVALLTRQEQKETRSSHILGRRNFFSRMLRDTVRSVKSLSVSIGNGDYDHIPASRRREMVANKVDDIRYYREEFRKWHASYLSIMQEV